MPPVLADHFEVGVLGPRPYWHVEDALVNILIPGVAHHFGNLAACARVEIHAETLQTFVDETPVLRDGVVWRHGIVGRDGVVPDFLRFNPSTGPDIPGGEKRVTVRYVA